MPVAKKTTSATTRKRRTRKAPVNQVKTVETNVRPTTLLKSTDYINDIKIRWSIHTYELNALVNDIKWSYNQVSNYVVKVYQQEFAK